NNNSNSSNSNSSSSNSNSSNSNSSNSNRYKNNSCSKKNCNKNYYSCSDNSNKKNRSKIIHRLCLYTILLHNLLRITLIQQFLKNPDFLLSHPKHRRLTFLRLMERHRLNSRRPNQTKERFALIQIARLVVMLYWASLSMHKDE